MNQPNALEGVVKYFKVERYSHCFVVTPLAPRGQEIIMTFAANYVQMGMVKVGRVFRRMPIKVFAARCPKRREVRFHHGQWNEFMAYVSGIGLTQKSYDLIEYGFYESDKVDMKIADGWSARDYQVPIIDYLASPEPSPIKLLEIQTGKGKAHPNSEAIKTPDGWTTVGELRAGSKVIDDLGMPVHVEEVYPQGAQPIYGIWTSDGRYARSTLDHLWSVTIVNKATKKAEQHTLSLRDIMTYGLASNSIYIPLPEAIVGNNSDLPFDAWCIGAIFSSGYLTKTADGKKTVRLILKNDFVVKRLEKELKQLNYELSPDGRHAFTITSTDGEWEDSELYALLAGGDSEQRRNRRPFIPKVYFEASIGARQALVSGIMDACGHVDAAARLVLKTNDEIFAEDFVYLVRSLGDKAYRSLKKKTYSVSIHTPATDNYFEDPELRQQAGKQSISRFHKHAKIAKIEYAGTEECTCLSIDNEDGLYVISDFLLTHNTYSAAEAIVRNGKRFIIFLKPQFIEKWQSDLKKLMNFSDDDLYTAQGSASLMRLIADARAGEIPYKAIIISNKTFQNWLTAYEAEGDALLEKGYDCHPHELMQILKVGVRLIDEVHMDFHLNFKIDLYTHVERSISLSATLISDDPFISSMQSVAYPKYLRYAGLAYDKYVNSFAYLYKLKPGVQLKTTEHGSGGKYSHHAFEKSLYKSSTLMASFLGMVETLTKRHFLNREGIKKGDRCLIYVSSIQFATDMVEYLLKKFKGLDIRRYVEDDPYENLMEAEICVSTVGSAGTGHDIDRLMTVILTTAISSSSSNIQGFGRLRNIPGQTEFIYLTCVDIEKHVMYHDKKNLMLGWMAKNKEIVSYHEQIG